MDDKERTELIRKGNEFFNLGNYTEAEKIFVATMYKDGLTRIADYFFYDKKMPISAYKYYKLAGRQDMINQIFERMVFAMKKMLRPEGEAEPEMKITLPQPKVHPKLRILAEEILRNNELQHKLKK